MRKRRNLVGRILMVMMMGVVLASTACQPSATTDTEIGSTPVASNPAGESETPTSSEETASPETAETVPAGDEEAEPSSDEPTTAAPVESAADGEAERLVALARAALSSELGVPAEEIKPVSVVPVDWPDASLGCPAAGEMAAQVITPGYRIILDVGGNRYEYHSNLDDWVILCPGEEADVGVPASGELPLFVEVIHTILMDEESSVGPAHNQTFSYLADTDTLLVAPTVSVSLDTALLVGVATVIQSVDQTLVSGDLYRELPVAVGQLEVISFSAASGGLTVRYGEQTIELLPGQSRSFKEAVTEGGATRVTIITNHGGLTALDVLEYAPGAR